MAYNSGSRNNKTDFQGYLIIFIVIAVIFALFFGGSSSGSGSYGGDGKTYTCNMCGRSISKTQSIRTHGYCSSCAKTLQDYLDRKDK